MTWLCIALAIWVPGIPVAVVIGRSIRLADERDAEPPDLFSGPADHPVRPNDSGSAR